MPEEFSCFERDGLIMRLQYYGHSAFGLENDDVRVLIDPWITDNPLCKMSVTDFEKVDSILVTHGAFDHLGDAPEIARRTGADIVCDYATGTVLEDRGFPQDQLHPYVWGAVHEGDGWKAKVVEAKHVSMFPDEGITAIPLGYVVTMGEERVYHMGDTSIFSDIELFGRLYDPTVALVPVGQAAGFFTELHPDEAALTTEWLDPDAAVPMHYEPGSDNPALYREECIRRGVDTETTIVEMEPRSSIHL